MERGSNIKMMRFERRSKLTSFGIVVMMQYIIALNILPEVRLFWLRTFIAITIVVCDVLYYDRDFTKRVFIRWWPPRVRIGEKE